MKSDHLPRSGADHLPPSPDRSFPKTDLGRAIETWLADGRAQGWSARTLQNRRWTFRHFLWWLENVEQAQPILPSLTPLCLRTFVSYVREPQPGGRYGTDHHTAAKAARPSTVQTFHRHLRAFFNWCLAEGLMEQSPLRNIKAPRVPNDQMQPFSPAQVQALLNAAQATEQRERNRAILLLLLDSGLRVSELCSLRLSDVDRTTGQIGVTGKGGKRRLVYMGTTARRALARYLQLHRSEAGPDEPLFHSEAEPDSMDAITPNGVRLMMRKRGRAAGVQGVPVSPHTARRTFAVNFLRGGGNLFELQALMGHSDLTVLRRYVALAETDLAHAHRQASPADRMGLR